MSSKRLILISHKKLFVNNENNTAACPISNAIANIIANHDSFDIEKNEIA
jgi:hypothetical protein